MIEMGKFISANPNGCVNVENYKKTDCYFFFEHYDMGAHIPCCTYADNGLGVCPCDNCNNYVPQSKVSEIVREYLKQKQKKE